MFTTAGMVQFKDIFTGRETPPHPRVATSQKCVRAGGKHNDLENVGYTARHHTFFEMLGNFSFGDYFKAGAIESAWNFLTKTLQINPARLLITVYADDEEAALLWRKIAGFSDEKIIRIATSDNFWSMGDTGPCGPCSEIFYDHGEHVAGGPPGSADADGDRFVEVWNLVFMQFEQQAMPDGTTRRVNLPRPSIDTGMGLERITTVLQGVHDNFDIDLFQTIIKASAEISKTDTRGPLRFSHRIIADHLRASAFLIADGVLPSNEGRGYVLRRIMRRAMRHAHGFGLKDPMLHQLVPVLVNLMGTAYPELDRAQPLISETLRLEEERFRATLGRGLKLLDDEVNRLGSCPSFPGDVAFKLYDTYGFPVDLTQDILKSRQISVDMDSFQKCMAQRQAEARAAWSGSGESLTDTIWLNLRDRLGGTEFLGYQNTSGQAKVLALIRDNLEVPEVAAGADVQIILNQTPFYAESGGQIGDTGHLKAAGAEIVVTDTIKRAEKVFVHVGKVISGTLKVGDVVDAVIDEARRLQIRANHSATHLLHAVLREHLGNHVSQKGSLVRPDRFRFDFSHPKALTAQDLSMIEAEMNRRIRANFAVSTQLQTPEEAIAAGALALFGEKYGTEVRVVSMGSVSTELCGGTHVSHTGDIGYFKIVGESSVASGVRRIEAMTGEAAESYVRQQETILAQLADLMKASVPDLPVRLQTLIQEKKKLEKNRGSKNDTADLHTHTLANHTKLYLKHYTDVAPKDLKSLADELRQKLGNGVIVLTTQVEDKISLVVSVSADLTPRISAVPVAQAAATLLGGKGGGGRVDMAQAGGTDVNRLPELDQTLCATIESQLS
jgi:alanyl-tRNA synthetase